MDDVFEPVGGNANDDFLRDVLSGLSGAQKTLPCQYLYDEAGSVLFEQITELPEYYPTRTEIGILNDNATQIAETLGADVLLVEYGAGASTKTRILLDSLETPAAYVPVDVSEGFLLQTAATLRQEYPDLDVFPIVGNFMADLDLPAGLKGLPVGFFPGSTLGNLSDLEIAQFMRSARGLLGEKGQFLIGVDLRKSPSVLVPAYDDAAGVTAAFNLNLLTRINRDLGANFDIEAFQHRSIWNDEASRIEMHLVSQCAQSVKIGSDSFDFGNGETIHTENSRKFDLEQLLKQFQATGWSLRAQWQDDRNYFAVLLLSPQK